MVELSHNQAARLEVAGLAGDQKELGQRLSSQVDWSEARGPSV
jgi:hypothetical protein